MDHLSASSLLRAVAEPVRLRMLHLLHVEELSVGELVRILELPQSSISRHLKALRSEGLVTDRAAGPATYYRAALHSELSNGQGRLRVTLAEMLPAEHLPSADRLRLDKVIALRTGNNGEFFDKIGIQWDALRESCFGASFHLEAFLTLLPRQWPVVDLGTGTGYLLPHLARYFAQVIAVDSSAAMLDLAKRRVAGIGNNIHFHEGRIEKLSLPTASVDLALAMLMLHHLQDLPAAINEIGRITCPGGRILVVDFHPHGNSAFQRRMADERAGLPADELAANLSAAGFININHHDLGQLAAPHHELGVLPQLYAVTAARSDGDQKFIKAAAQRPKSHAPSKNGRNN